MLFRKKKRTLSDWHALYPPAMQDGFRRYDTAKQQHKRLPDLRQAMNKQLKKELNT